MLAAAAAAMGKWIGGYGKKPVIPNFTPVDAGEVQLDAVADNAAALPGAQNLAAAFNKFSLQELEKSLSFLLPGALGQVQSNITNQLFGVADVADTKSAIRNATAAGWGSGTAGSQFGNMGVIGGLGRSVAQQRQQGFSNFLNFSQSVMPKQFDPSNMFFTPAQRLAHAVSERDDKFNIDLLKAQVKAAPDPGTAAVAQGIMQDDAYWGGIFSNLMGGAIGGGGGAPASGGGGGKFGGGSSWG